MKPPIFVFFVLIVFYSVTSSHAQIVDSLNGNAAFLFGYYPKENLRAEFEQGYKKHLEWHKQKNDQLAWYAWYVQTGSRLGLFIDGTFGISFHAFDNRVDQPGDRADFAETTAPFADLAFRKIYYLRKDLSTDFLLEKWAPTSSMEVYEITVTPGTEYLFEAIFLELRPAVEKNKEKPVYTLYELLSGDEHSTYLLMIPRNNFSYFDDHAAVTTVRYLIELYLPDRATALFDKLAKSIKQMTSETWGYRKDLSYFPEH